MRVKESIAELRRICQYARYDEQMPPWPERILIRSISIYFTKLFLEIGISANQATSFSLIIGIIGGLFFIFPDPRYWFIGIALLGVHMILDRVDGEIARFNKTASLEGTLWDKLAKLCVRLCTLICVSFGVYNTLHSIYPILVGFVGVMALYLSTNAILLPYPILYAKGLLSGATSSAQTAKSQEQTNIIVRYGRLLFDFPLIWLLGLLLCSVIVDSFISPFTIGSLSFNARYICLIIYTLSCLAGAIRDIYLTLHDGVLKA